MIRADENSFAGAHCESKDVARVREGYSLINGIDSLLLNEFWLVFYQVNNRVNIPNQY